MINVVFEFEMIDQDGDLVASFWIPAVMPCLPVIEMDIDIGSGEFAVKELRWSSESPYYAHVTLHEINVERCSTFIDAMKERYTEDGWIKYNTADYLSVTPSDFGQEPGIVKLAAHTKGGES